MFFMAVDLFFLLFDPVGVGAPRRGLFLKQFTAGKLDDKIKSAGPADGKVSRGIFRISEAA